MAKPILEIRCSAPIDDDGADSAIKSVKEVVKDDYHVIFIDKEFSLSVKDDSIQAELRAIKATLSAIAIKLGAISNPFSITITGQDDYTSLTSEQREELKRWSDDMDKEMNIPK